MRKHIFLILLLVMNSAFNVMAQNKKDDKKMLPKSGGAEAYKVNPADVSTIDGLIKATYDVISGASGEKRNWDRFRSLFHRDGKLIPTFTNPNNGVTGATAFTPDEYIKRSESFMMKNGFYEKEIAQRKEVFGNIAHIFSTYEGKNKLEDEKVLVRGINSFQLLNDGKRWWIMTIYWQAETPKNKVPSIYMTSK